MITIQYGQWSPDTANVSFQMPDQEGPVTVPVADCLNVYYANGAYQSLPTAAPVLSNPNLPSQCIGAFTSIDQNGNPIPFAGTTADAYWYASLGFGWTALSSSPANTPSQWNFARFGSLMYAQYLTNNIAAGYPPLYQIAVQNAASPSSSIISITTAPSGRVMGVVGQFLMIGDIYADPTATPATPTSIGTGNGVTTSFAGNIPATQVPAYPTSVTASAGAVTGQDNGNGSITGTGVSGTVNYENGVITLSFSVAPTNGTAINVSSSQLNRPRLHWSAIGNPSSWPTPLTNAAIAVQSGIQDLEAEYGPITGISGYPLYGVIFQRNAITRANYIGGNVVFSWQTFSRNLGLVAPSAMVQVGANTFFLADQGFHYTDGANVTPIGTAQDNSAGIDAWFFANVNKSALSAIKAGYDGNKRNLFFAIPTGSNTLPDTVLCYNVLSGRWTRAAQFCEFIWSDTDGTTNRLGIFNQSNAYCLLTGTPSTAYLESCDLSFSDGLTRFTPSVRPNIACTDTPNAIVGVRNSLESPVIRCQPGIPDAFSAGFAPTLNQKGLYTRVMVISNNASAINGATMKMKSGGPL